MPAESECDALGARLREALEVLKSIEWSGGIYEPHCAGRCPMCEAEVEWDRTKTPAHAPDCRLAALLAARAAPREDAPPPAPPPKETP